MKYLLDTNVASDWLRGVATVVQRIQKSKPAELALSAVTAMELRYGAARKQSTKLIASVEGFLAGIAILPFEVQAAERAGILRADLESKGRCLSLADCQIAATALVLGLTLVSNDADFRQVSGLKLTDWRGGR